MAEEPSKFNLSKLNFFNRLDARARVLVLSGGVVAIVFLVYLGTHFIFGGGKTTGASRVANAPSGLQSVPGGALTAEYQRALIQANTQAVQQARMSGGSAVNTMLNTGQPNINPAAQCNIICAEQTANVKNLLDDWVRQGKISPDVATELERLADQNMPLDDYAARLNELVKEGKLTPEQARELLEQYKKQHAGALLQDSAKMMDALIKSGQLPLDAANELLSAQKRGVTPAEYAAILQRLVREGKISPATAQQLLAQYTQQRAKEITMQSIAALHQMAKAGQMTSEVEAALVDLENRMVPLDTYAATLQQYVSSGKLTPAVANTILDEFKRQKAAIGPTGSIDQLVQKAEAAAFQEIDDLLKTGKITPDVATVLRDMINKNISLADFQTAVNQLVAQKKLSPDIAKLKIADYQAVKGLRDMAQHLGALQGNNASATDYAGELKRTVQAGLISPEEAAQLMQEYQALVTKPVVAGAPTLATPGAEEFARLQQRVQQAGAAAQPVPAPAEFAAAQTQVVQETAQDRQARIEALMSAMSGQAQQLVASWQPPTMAEKVGAVASNTSKENMAAAKGTQSTTTTVTTENLSSGAPLIKAGAILFAVLDTAVNSDYPDSPVMVTIVDGPYKGAKLLGKLTTAKTVAGQLDRVSLNFTVMNLDAWPRSKSVTAYAIDPDTARVVLASNVNYHYMQRFGAIMATSFMQGFSSAITNEGTSTTGIFGTSTTHPSLSTGQKLAVGLGQIGQTLGSVTQGYANIPPTVKVDSGVGLGILFMSDVT